MTIYHKNLADRYRDFSPEQQILMVCNELNRAKKLYRDEEEFRTTLYRALELLDFTRLAPAWIRSGREIHIAREYLAYLTTVEEPPLQQLEMLMSTLIALSPASFRMLNK